MVRLSSEEQSEFELIYSTLEQLRHDLWRLLELCGDDKTHPSLGHHMAGTLKRAKELIGREDGQAVFRSAEAQLAVLSDKWGELKASDAALILGPLTETLHAFGERHSTGSTRHCTHCKAGDSGGVPRGQTHGHQDNRAREAGTARVRLRRVEEADDIGEIEYCNGSPAGGTPAAVSTEGG